MYQLNSEESSRIEIMRVVCALFVLYIHAYFPQLQVPDGSGGMLYTGPIYWLKRFAIARFQCLSVFLRYCFIGNHLQDGRIFERK